LHCGVLFVLLRFLNLDLLEVPGPLQRGYKVRHRIQRSGSALHRYRRAFLRQSGQPQVFRARDGVGHFIQQFLAARAIPLQLFDRADTLLQNLLTLFEIFHLQLDLLQFRFLPLQRLDSLRFIRQLRLPRME
jgi:hypothetical protein